MIITCSESIDIRFEELQDDFDLLLRSIARGEYPAIASDADIDDKIRAEQREEWEMETYGEF